MADSSVPLSDAPDVSEDADKPVQPVAPTKDLLPAVVDQKLKLQLSGLLIDKRPLSETLTTLSLMSDVPMMADIDALLAAGLPRNPVIEFRSTTPITLGNMLKKIETDAQLTFVPWENKLIYVRGMPAAIESRVPAALQIHDLVTDEPQTQNLVQVIHEILPELADKVQIKQGSLTIELTAENRLAWFQAARLLESWRASRGIQNVETSQLVPLTSQLPAWPMEAMRQIAQTKIKQSLSPEPIARSWQRLAAEAKIYCWVDAFALLSSDVSPADKAMVLSSGRSLGNILNNYTEKFGVIFAVEDSRSLWVTTPTMHRLQPRLYVVPQSDKSAEQWTSELESLAPLHPNSGASMLKVLPSPDGKYFFIRACRPLLESP
ncbi:MAG: hypothetical protein IT423_24350 [Pirellulaceae bacterium]|nr:hypothetical protein [Pirellulaceae bacterium]